jgi:hypothetical protein
MALNSDPSNQSYQSLPSRDDFLHHIVVSVGDDEQDLAQSDLSCTICGEVYQTGVQPESATRFVCGHVFGINCAMAWFNDVDGACNYRNTCPLCRRELYRKEMAPINREEDPHWYDSLIEPDDVVSELDDEDVPHVLWIGHPGQTQSGRYEYTTAGQSVRQEDNEMMAILGSGFTTSLHVPDWIVEALIADRFPFLHLAEMADDDDSGDDFGEDDGNCEHDYDIDQDVDEMNNLSNQGFIW